MICSSNSQTMDHNPIALSGTQSAHYHLMWPQSAHHHCMSSQCAIIHR